jgi:hypothetical protein
MSLTLRLAYARGAVRLECQTVVKAIVLFPPAVALVDDIHVATSPSA